MKEMDEMKDNEVRIVGADPTQPVVFPTSRPRKQPSVKVVDEPMPASSKRSRAPLWISLAALVLSLLVALFFILRPAKPVDKFAGGKGNVVKMEPTTFDTTTTVTATVVREVQAGVKIKSDSINDIHLTVFYPVGCKASLMVGQVNVDDPSILLCAQAADIRSDNKEIVSAFVLHGEPISRGVAKRGFCAIIKSYITLGMSEETPLYERVVEDEGDFFRQYPLVHDSQMIVNKPKGKAVRKALCMFRGKVCIIATTERESYYDFAQALQDYGVTEAIALVGADATLFARTPDGELHNYGVIDSAEPNINYIVFRK